MASYGASDRPGGPGGKGGPETRYDSKRLGGLGPGKNRGPEVITGTAGAGAAWPGAATPSPAMTPVEAPALATAAPAAAPATAQARVASLFTPALTRRRRAMERSPSADTARGYGFA